MTLQKPSRAAAGAFRKLALAASVAGLMGAALPAHAANAVVLIRQTASRTSIAMCCRLSRRRKASRSTS